MPKIRMRIEDPKGRLVERVRVEQRVKGVFVPLGQVEGLDRIRVTTRKTDEVLQHLKVIIEWQGGLVSEVDDLFVSEDKEILIRPDPNEMTSTVPVMATKTEIFSNPSKAKFGLFEKARSTLKTYTWGVISGLAIVGFFSLRKRIKGSQALKPALPGLPENASVPTAVIEVKTHGK